MSDLRAASISPGSGWGNADVSNGGDVGVVEDQIINSTGTFAGTAALSYSENTWVGLIVAYKASGVVPQGRLSPNPASFNFSSVQVGTIGSETIVLTNTGTAALTISQATASGAGFGLTGLPIPTTIPVGQNATFFAQFSPTTPGSASGSISITSNAAGSPLTIPLGGTGTQPQITLSSTNVSFGSVVVGSSSPQSVTLTNSGTAPLTVSQATVSGSGFSLSGLSPPQTINPAGTATLSLTFTPASAGNSSGSVSITSNAPGSPTAIPLSGTGTQGQLSPNPASFNFSSVQVGTIGSETIVLTNTGTAALTISQATASGAGFGLTGLPILTTIPVGQNTTFFAQFSPTTPGSASGSISITSNAAGSPLTIPLSGTAFQPLVVATPSIVDLGHVVTGNTNSSTVQLTNNGTSTVTFSQITVTGAGFSITGLSPSTTIAPGASTTFNVSFAPLSSGGSAGSIDLTSGVPNSSLTIPLNGHGLDPTYLLGASPTTSSFGYVPVGRSSGTLNVVLTNNGNSNVTISGVAVSGPGFTATGIAPGTTLTPGQSAQLTVTFTPTTSSTAGGSIAVMSNATTSPLTILLSASAGCDGNGNCYVRSGATGGDSGSDWTNAYTDLPPALSRGFTYYVAGGNYGSHTFQDADLGTSAITIKAATLADHGTDTDWSSSYVGQAVWTPPIQFYGDYYTFNGAYRGSGSGNAAIDWTSGYGFLIRNNNGSDQPIIAPSCPDHMPIVAVGNNNPVLAHDVRVLYTEVSGSQDNTGTYCDWGIEWDSGTQGASATNNYLGYSYVHDTGSNLTLLDGQQNAIIEYSWIKNNWSTAAVHSEGLTLRGSGGSIGDNNVIARYNYWENIVGTAFVAFPANQPGNSNIYIYGNVFFVNQSEANGQGVGSSEQAAEGVLALDIGSTTITGDFYFVNNTISSLWSTGNCGASPITEFAGSYNAVFENNLWYNCPQNNNPPPSPGGSGTFTWDYNSYYQSPTMCPNDTAAHTSCSSTNPFIAVGNVVGADNFNLITDTAAGTALSSSLPLGCAPGVNCMDIDISGATRGGNGVWDRGALQLTPGASPQTISCSPNSQPAQTNQNVSLNVNPGSAADSWSAPGGNPAIGTGPSFLTSYALPGFYTVAVTSGSISAQCAVTVTAQNSKIALVQKNIPPTGGSPQSAGFSANTSAGNTIVAVAASNSIDPARPIAITDSQNNVYSCTNNYYNANGLQSVIICWAALIPGGRDTVTAMVAGNSSNHVFLAIYEYAGLSGTLDNVAGQAASLSTTALATPLITTTNPNDLLIAGFDDNDNEEMAAGPGFAADIQNFLPAMSEYAVTTQTGTYTATAVLNGPADASWVGVIVALKANNP